MSWDLCRTNLGACNSNSCMKLSFEAGKVNARVARWQPPADASRPVVAAAHDTGGKISLADEERRGDRCGQKFLPQKLKKSPIDFYMSELQRELSHTLH